MVASKKEERRVYNPSADPAYSASEAARYLKMPRSTLSGWFQGRSVTGSEERTPQVIVPARARPLRLSFENLVEAYVMLSLRVGHEISMQHARSAVEHMKRICETDRPLLSNRLYVDEDMKVIFVEKYGKLIEATTEQQVAMSVMLERRLKHVEREDGLVRRLFPFLNLKEKNEMMITIDPRRGFGRPIISGTNIRIEIIAERFRAGEPANEIARDYGIGLAEVEQALRVQDLEAA